MKEQTRKWFSRFYRILPLMLLALALCCMGVGVDDKIRLNDENKKHIEFAVKMFRELNPKSGEPALLSPYCLEMNLAILAQGSAGETRQQIEAAANVLDFERQKKLFQQFHKGSDVVAVNNRMEYDPSEIRFKREFVSKIQEDEFCKVALKKKGWDDSRAFQLTSFLKFDDEWQTPFEPKNVERDFYQTLDSLPVKCMMMAMNETSLYGHQDEYWESVLLPFRNSDFQMLLLKPREIIPHEELASHLSADTIVTHLSKGWTQSYYVRIPKFKFENKLNMLEILQKLDITLNRDADFSQMYEPINWKNLLKLKPFITEEVWIGGLIQENQFEINEVRARGESRTIATGFSFGCSGGMYIPSEYFIADRPFIFILFHKPSKTILFMGSFDINTQEVEQ